MSPLLAGAPRWEGLLLVAQQAGGSDMLIGPIYVLAFLGVFIFTFVGFLLFSVGWESYEERYLEGAERTLDDLFLTIPPQQLLWLSLFGYAFAFVGSWLLSGAMSAGMIVGIGGYFVPRLLLAFHKRRRAAQFAEQLVPALNTITNALRTGLSMPKAFQLIATDMPKPICQEFGILVQELRLGSEIDEGLDNMLERMPGQDLDLVVTSTAISNEVGGNLAEVFDRIAYTIRERRRIEGRIDALTAQGKMQGLLVSAMPIFLGVIIHMIDPTMMAPLFTTTIGHFVIGVMVFFEILGFVVIKKITTIEV